MTPMYIVSLERPLRDIRLIPADIRTHKWTWALCGGRRHLIGASAFFTLTGACRARAGILMRLVDDTYIKFKFPGTQERARQLLADYHKNGGANWTVRRVK